MTTADGGVVQASFTETATALAGRVLTALRTDGEVGLADFVNASTGTTAALGAVRVVGADIFVPHVLLNRPLDPADARIVADSFAMFPPADTPATPEQWVGAWRDWATVRLMLHLAGPPADDLGNVPPPPESLPVALGDARSWQQWAVRVAQLSPLALLPLALFPSTPSPLDSSVTSAVAAEATALALGVSRAMLRRDYTTAARLARWTALLAGMADVESPLDPVLLVEHLRLHAGAGPRLLLDLAVARRLLALEPE
jgi:hypothetical protein